MGKCRPWVNVAMGICRMGICRMGICRLTHRQQNLVLLSIKFMLGRAITSEIHLHCVDFFANRRQAGCLEETTLLYPI